MGFADINVFGVVISPLVPMILAAFAVWLALRRIFIASGLTQWLWHPALFDVSVFLIVLSAIILTVGVWGSHV